MSKPGRSLAELLAAAEARKHQAIRERLGIPASRQIEGFQLESLGYHLAERSGTVHLRMEGEVLRVSDAPGAPGISYQGDARDFLMEAWGVTREAAARGCEFEVKAGKRVD